MITDSNLRPQQEDKDAENGAEKAIWKQSVTAWNLVEPNGNPISLFVFSLQYIIICMKHTHRIQNRIKFNEYVLYFINDHGPLKCCPLKSRGRMLSPLLSAELGTNSIKLNK